MIFSRTLAILSLPFFVAAQYGPSPATTSAPAAAAPAGGSMQVLVGDSGSITYGANKNIKAAKGTNVTFVFPSGKSHSVTQSSFGAPCTHLPANGSTPAGFDSGFVTEAKSWTIMITNDQKPIWYFCKFAKHCSGGMVGAINAPTNGTNTFEAYTAAATKITNQPPVTDNGPVEGGGVNAQVVPNPTSPSSTGGSSSTSTSKPSGAAGKLSASTGLTFLGVLLAFVTA
jgi:plastocyanin